MTIIAWDGKDLVTDRRRSTKKIQCRTVTDVTDVAEKIDTEFKKISFGGSKILAIASAGSVKTTRYLKEALRDGEEIDAIAERVLDTENEIVLRKATLFILTEKSAWVVRVKKGNELTVTEVASTPVFLGDGAKVALFLTKAFHLNILEAAMYVQLGLDSCGGGIAYVTREGKKLSEVRYVESFENRSKALQKVASSLTWNALLLPK